MGPIVPSPTLHVLALCGSLRAASINAALLRAAARIVPADVEVAAVVGQALSSLRAARARQAAAGVPVFPFR